MLTESKGREIRGGETRKLIYSSEANAGKTAGQHLKNCFPSPENTCRFMLGKCGTKVGGHMQVGSKGQVDHCLGVSYPGSCWCHGGHYCLKG